MVNVWKFSDPEDLAVFTLTPVLNGARPVLYVSHDISEGSWQFLTGEDVNPDDVQLVRLAEVIGMDPSLNALSDLPLGWHAERAALNEAWTRQPTFPVNWADLVIEAEAYTHECQHRLKAEFSLSEWERYDYHQEAASLVFSSGGVPRVRMNIQIVGSWSARAGTWFWSWSNATILPSANEYVGVLKTFGEQNDFGRLSTPLWPAKESDAWQMASLACLLLQGDGVYRAPGEDGSVFMVVTDPTFVDS
jgi:hypothetical protein